MCGPLGGGPDASKQDRKADEALHKSKMQLLEGIANHVDKLRKESLPENDPRVQAVVQMTPHQKIRCLNILSEKCAYWGSYPAPIEQSLVNQAYDEFKSCNYRHSIIYEYLTYKDLDNILSLK